ncbi:MAG: serpin family protein [Planctomycetota bacterium]
MRYLLLMALILAGCAGDEVEPVTPPTVTLDEAALDAAAAATNGFAIDLLREADGENVHLSPVSIAAAFGMASEGARGETRTHMLDVLGLSDAPDNASAGLAALAQSSEGFELTVANAGWVADEFPIEPGYVEDVRQRFGAGFEVVDFTDPPAAADRINRWIAANTADRIENLISPEMIKPALTKLMLTNAVYFKADWEQPFENASTNDRPFQTPAGEVRAPRMHQEARFGYATLDGFAALQMDYVGGASMLVLLPDEGGSVDALLGEMDSDALAEVDAGLNVTTVLVGLPKFETRVRTELIELMKTLGMTLPFTDAADFGGITTSEPLLIGAALHEVFIRIDEKGTEAAAATALGMEVASAPMEPPPSFIVDRPFVYLIRSADGVILFAGKVSDPTQ